MTTLRCSRERAAVAASGAPQKGQKGNSPGSSLPQPGQDATSPSLSRPRAKSASLGPRYLISVSILNIGRYIEMMITPTIMPTPIIINGSMIEVSDWIAASTSSS